MNRPGGFSLSIIVLLLSNLLTAQDISHADSIKPSEDNLFSPVYVTLKSGQIKYGFLTKIQADSIYISFNNDALVFSRDAIRALEIETGQPSGGSVLTAAVMTMYVGSLLLFRAEGHPVYYADRGEFRSDNMFGLLVAYTALYAGGGVLGLLKQVQERHRIVRLPRHGSFESSPASWDDLPLLLKSRRKKKRRAHFRIVMGKVFPGTSENLADYGFAFQKDFGHELVFDPEIRGAQPFNFTRRIEIAYSVKPDLRIGFAGAWFGEPTVVKFRDDPRNFFDDESLIQYVDGSGFFVTANYVRPLFSGSKRILWNAGGGLGFTRVEMQRDYSDVDRWFSYSTIQSGSRNGIGVMLQAQLEFYAYPHLSFDVGADYVRGQTLQLQAYPDLNIPAQEYVIGNWSLDFAIGVHF